MVICAQRHVKSEFRSGFISVCGLHSLEALYQFLRVLLSSYRRQLHIHLEGDFTVHPGVRIALFRDFYRRVEVFPLQGVVRRIEVADSYVVVVLPFVGQSYMLLWIRVCTETSLISFFTIVPPKFFGRHNHI